MLGFMYTNFEINKKIPHCDFYVKIHILVYKYLAQSSSITISLYVENSFVFGRGSDILTS